MYNPKFSLKLNLNKILNKFYINFDNSLRIIDSRLEIFYELIKKFALNKTIVLLQDVQKATL